MRSIGFAEKSNDSTVVYVFVTFTTHTWVKDLTERDWRLFFLVLKVELHVEGETGPEDGLVLVTHPVELQLQLRLHRVYGVRGLPVQLFHRLSLPHVVHPHLLRPLLFDLRPFPFLCELRGPTIFILIASYIIPYKKNRENSASLSELLVLLDPTTYQ